MLESELLGHLDAPLASRGATLHDGQAYDEPPLVVLRFASRPTRVSRLPLLGRALGVVVVAREPVDLGFDAAGLKALLVRLGRAASYRFPNRLGPQGGLAIGLTAVVLTPRPIDPDDDARLDAALSAAPAGRSLPVGLFRVNLARECVAMAWRSGPRDGFPEPLAVAETLGTVLARHLDRIPTETA